MEHVSTALRRAVSRLPRRRLAPLEPDRFLAWAYTQMQEPRGTGPLTVDDVWFELARGIPDLAREEVRRDYVRIAARVRRNQRLGLPPFEGI